MSTTETTHAARRRRPTYDVTRRFDHDHHHNVERRLFSSDESKLQLSRDHAVRELETLERAANFLFWGAHEPGLPALDALRFDTEVKDHPEGELITRQARECGALRRYIERVDEALLRCREERYLRTQQDLREQEERADREAFEAHEAAERERRFQEFRAARRGGGG